MGYLLSLLSPVFDMWFANAHILGAPPRSWLLILLVITALLTLTIRKRYPDFVFDPLVRAMLGLILAFIAWSILINFAHYLVNQESEILSVAIRKILARYIGGALLLLSIAFFLADESRIRIFVYVLFVTLAFSSVVGILQLLDPSLGWSIKPAMLKALHLEAGGRVLSYRVGGLADFSVPFSYQLAAIIPLIFALLLEERNPLLRGGLIIAYVLGLTALLMTLMRSAILGVFLAHIVVLYASRGTSWTRRLVFLVLPAGLVVYLLLKFNPFVLERFQRRLEGERTDVGRIVLIQSATDVLFAHPLGVGIGRFQEVASGTVSETSRPELASLVVTQTTAHNQFINTWIYNGIVGFLLLISLYVLLFRHLGFLLRAGRRRGRLAGALAVGLLGANVSYLTHSMFHNAGPFGTGEYVFWYLLVLQFSLAGILYNLYNRYENERA
ncbi:MAG: O-antigen ligase family protein [Candidatus Hydrothermae bacterium]|nr:O-antigen ligase family protein [Candidatus Hydrothermae bacterium]